MSEKFKAILCWLSAMGIGFLGATLGDLMPPNSARAVFGAIFGVIGFLMFLFIGLYYWMEDM